MWADIAIAVVTSTQTFSFTRARSSSSVYSTILSRASVSLILVRNRRQHSMQTIKAAV